MASPGTSDTRLVWSVLLARARPGPSTVTAIARINGTIIRPRAHDHERWRYLMTLFSLLLLRLGDTPRSAPSRQSRAMGSTGKRYSVVLECSSGFTRSLVGCRKRKRPVSCSLTGLAD